MVKCQNRVKEIEQAFGLHPLGPGRPPLTPLHTGSEKRMAAGWTEKRIHHPNHCLSPFPSSGILFGLR